MITYRDVNALRAGLQDLFDITTDGEVKSGLGLALDQCDDMLARIVSGQEALGAYTMELIQRYHESEAVGESPDPAEESITLEDRTRGIAFAGVGR